MSGVCKLLLYFSALFYIGQYIWALYFLDLWFLGLFVVHIVYLKRKTFISTEDLLSKLRKKEWHGGIVAQIVTCSDNFLACCNRAVVRFETQASKKEITYENFASFP